MGRKLGAVPPFLGEAGSPSNTKAPGKPTSIPSGILIHPAIWPQRTWAKNWGAVSLLGGGVGSLSNTMWPGPRSTCVLSFIPIHKTVWQQYTNVKDRRERQAGQDRTDRQDNGPIESGEPFDKWSPKKQYNYFPLFTINTQQNVSSSKHNIMPIQLNSTQQRIMDSGV